ncbi:hypothetical protein [Skermanella stibiiresistens]|nr:hypothetical protein [Skermanella stibiiresistens]
MQFHEPRHDENDSGGHMGAAAGLIIGIILGSLMLNFTASDASAKLDRNAVYTDELETMING